MNREELQELACLRALGALSPEEVRAFDEQLRRDPELRKLYQELQNVTDAMVLNVKPAAPSPGLKNRILAATAGPAREKIVPLPQPPVERRPSSNWIPWALAACLAIFAGGLLWYNAHNRFEPLVVLLNSKVEGSTATAVSVWDDRKQEGTLIVQNLAPLPANKDYQLWVISPKRKAPIDAGVFSVDEKGAARIRFKPKANVDIAGTFAVTLEKKGGVPAPEGTMVLLGSAN